MLPLISGWEREKLHPCSAAPGFGAIGARLESPAQPPGHTRGEEGERHFDKAKSANSPVPEPPWPAGKSDKHPALNRLSVGVVLHCIYGKWGLEEAPLCRTRDTVLWLNREMWALSICP